MAKSEEAKTESKCTSVAAIFSKPWQKSDLILQVEDKEIHVHRWMLCMQSKVFESMLNGNFKDAFQKKIELKDDKYEAMIHFLMLLYPANMLDENEVNLNNDNILQVINLADKYEAINVVKQCLKEVNNIHPKTAMHLLTFAARNNLPIDTTIDVIKKHVSSDELKNFSQNLSSERLTMVVLAKCKHLENTMGMAHTLIMKMIEQIEQHCRSGGYRYCHKHGSLNARSLNQAKQCDYCMFTYQKKYVDCLKNPFASVTKDEVFKKRIFSVLFDIDDIVRCCSPISVSSSSSSFSSSSSDD